MVKVISLSNEAYEKLKRIKNGKSFSEIVVELVDRKKDRKGLMNFAGIFANDKDWANKMNEIIKDRKNIKMREVKF